MLKSSGGFVWACKNYDGDVQSDIVAQGVCVYSPSPLAAADDHAPREASKHRPSHALPHSLLTVSPRLRLARSDDVGIDVSGRSDYRI